MSVRVAKPSTALGQAQATTNSEHGDSNSGSKLSDSTADLSSFRISMDALRGDRRPSIGNKPLNREKSDQSRYSSSFSLRPDSTADFSITNSFAENTKGADDSWNSQNLTQFLLDATMDEKLSEYVERKLRQSQTTTETKKNPRKGMLEPPPSLSVTSSIEGFRDSMDLSMRMSTEGSMIPIEPDPLANSYAVEDQDMPPESEENTSDVKAPATVENVRVSWQKSPKKLPQEFRDLVELEKLRVSQKLRELNTSETSFSKENKNMTDVEKLRISQKLRDINKVLNGFMDFEDCYLSKKYTSSISSFRRSQLSDGDDEFDLHESNKQVQKQQQVEQEMEKEEEDDSEDDNEEEDLPAMVEKGLMKQSPPSNIVKNVASEYLSTSTSIPSSPSKVEVSTSSPKKPSSPSNIAAAARHWASLTSMRSASVSKTKSKRQRTKLHQQLIDRTIQNKRLEVQSSAFVRWRRGLRLQRQNRVFKSQMTKECQARLVTSRARRLLFEWLLLTKKQKQLVQERFFFFQKRLKQKLVFKIFTKWKFIYFFLSRSNHKTKKNEKMICFKIIFRNLLGKKKKKMLQKAFSKWIAVQTVVKGKKLPSNTKEKNERKRFEKIATRFDQKKKKQRFFLIWKVFFFTQKTKFQNLFRIVLNTKKRLLSRGFNKWKSVFSIEKRVFFHQSNANKLTKALTEQQLFTAQVAQELEETKQKLHEMLQRDASLELNEQAKQQAHVKYQQTQKHQLQTLFQQLVETFLQQAIQKQDEKLLKMTSQVETFMTLAEKDLQNARFRAASALVEMTMSQKLTLSNERLSIQENVVRILSNSQITGMSAEDVFAEQNQIDEENHQNLLLHLSNNAEFFYDMLQQRFKRQLQLNQEMAKLAASVTEKTFDRAKLRDAKFLVDSIYQRDMEHVQEILHLYNRLNYNIRKDTNK